MQDLHQQIIREYYTRVDAGDVNWVLDLFAEDSQYLRAEARYGNKAEITDFYRGQRKITGVHTLADVYEAGDTVIVNGRFDGEGLDGSEKHIGFADFWQFNDEDRVVCRRTYLAVGSQVVRE